MRPICARHHRPRHRGEWWKLTGGRPTAGATRRDRRPDCDFRRVAAATAAPSTGSTPRAWRVSLRMNWLRYGIVFWSSSASCNRRRAQQAGRRAHWPPRTGSLPMMRSWWRRRSNRGSWTSPRPRATEASANTASVTDTAGVVATDQPEPVAAERGHQPDGIDKSMLAIPAPRRYRNKAHLRYVARQPCLLCGRKPSDPHHLRFMQPRALGRKASDEFSVPLCRIHHRLVHRVGNEAAWWKEAGIDPIAVARKLWGQTRRAEGRHGAAPTNEVPRSASDQDRLLPSVGTDGTRP